MLLLLFWWCSFIRLIWRRLCRICSAWHEEPVCHPYYHIQTDKNTAKIYNRIALISSTSTHVHIYIRIVILISILGTYVYTNSSYDVNYYYFRTIDIWINMFIYFFFYKYDHYYSLYIYICIQSTLFRMGNATFLHNIIIIIVMFTTLLLYMPCFFSLCFWLLYMNCITSHFLCIIHHYFCRMSCRW